jgi:hypothetical protein
MDWGDIAVFLICTAIACTYITFASKASLNNEIYTIKEEQTDTSSLFLVGIVKDSKSFLVPILISTNDTINMAQAGTWTANGRKMGLGGRYIGGEYILEADTQIQPYVRSISYVSDISPLDNTYSPPIPYPSVGNKKMFTYTVSGVTAQTKLFGPNGSLLGGTPIEDPPMNYKELQDLALGTLGTSCTPLVE